MVLVMMMMGMKMVLMKKMVMMMMGMMRNVITVLFMVVMVLVLLLLMGTMISFLIINLFFIGVQFANIQNNILLKCWRSGHLVLSLPGAGVGGCFV